MSHRKLLKRSVSLVALCASAALPLTAHASAASEVATAAEHAGFSAASPNLEMAHAHLHHTLNCLVGPHGRGFDTKAMDPCEGQGNGAIPDTKNMARKRSLEAVAIEVRSALQDHDLKSVVKDATLIHTKLKAMKMK